MVEIKLDHAGLVGRIRNLVEMAGGASRFAESRGLSPSQVSEALSSRSIGPRILKAVGVERRVTVTYIVKGSNEL